MTAQVDVDHRSCSEVSDPTALGAKWRADRREFFTVDTAHPPRGGTQKTHHGDSVDALMTDTAEKLEVI